jgi:hypothetical protein
MTDEKFKIMREEWEKLKSFIKEVEFNDIDYKNMFDRIDSDVLFHFAFLAQCSSKNDINNDIAYVEHVKSITDTIDKKQSISYKQFRVLCFFYKRILYRRNNPIKLQSKDLVK